MFSSLACGPLALLALGLALSAPGAAVEAVPSTLALTLRAQVQLDGPRIALGDVAVLPPGAAPELALLDLGASPRVNALERLTRTQIALLIQRRSRQPLAALAWHGADSVSVQRKSQLVAGSVLGEAAVQAVIAAYGSRFPGLQAVAPAQPDDVDVATGAYTLRARALDSQQLPARAVVWLDLVADGQVLRSVVVPVTLTWRRPVYLARRTLAGGAMVRADDFEVSENNVAGLNAQPVTDEHDAPGWRLRRTMQAGQILTRQLLPATGTVFPGDRVRVHTRSGAIGIDIDAVVQAEAAPGQLVAVRAPTSSDTLTGRLTVAGTVVME